MVDHFSRLGTAKCSRRKKKNLVVLGIGTALSGGHGLGCIYSIQAMLCQMLSAT
jgi:hypothetical protein